MGRIAHPASEAFWLVWNPDGRAPTFEHPSPDHAEREARRLADLNPGSTFYVLHATHALRRVDPVQKTELPCPIPF